MPCARDIRPSAYKAGVAVFAATACYYLFFCSYGINLWDEGGIYVGGLRYLDGQSVNKDFFGYQPGRYLLVEAIFRVFGTEMLPVRYLFAVLSGFFGVFAFQICRRLMPAPFMIPAVLLVVSAPAVYYQRFYGLGFLFSAWAVAVYLEDNKKIFWLVTAGAYAYLFRPEILGVALPVYCYLAWIRRKDFRKGALAVICIAALFLIAFNVSAIESFLPMLENHYGRWSNPFPVLWEGYQGENFGFLALLENSLFYLPFISGGLLLALALREKRRFLFVLAYLQLAGMSLVIMRAGFDNLVRCLPLFFIAASYIAFRIVKLPALRPAGRTALSALLLFLWFSYMAVFNVANGFYSGSIGAIRGASVELKVAHARGIRVRPYDAEIISAVTGWIQTSTGAEEPILALPLNPLWYFMAARRNPTRYDWVLPATLVGDNADEAELLKQLGADPPALVVFVDIEIDNNPQRRLENYAPLLMRWLFEYYEYSGSVAYFQMWERKK